MLGKLLRVLEMPDKGAFSSIKFHFKHKSLYLKNRQPLKNFVLSIFKKERTNIESLQYIFCSDKELLQINRQFLKHDYYTDIISFNLAGKSRPIEGEIYISLDRVKSNALELNQPAYIELHRVIFHGVLHFCGYKDKTRAEIAKMRDKEDYYLNRYFR